MPLKVNLVQQPLDAFGEDLDLGHVFAQDPAGNVLRGARFCFGRPARQVPLLGPPSGVGAWRLQPTRLLVKACRPSPFAQIGTASIPPTAVRLGPFESAMQEILFLVEEAEDGSFRASAAAAAIHTEADTLEDLHREIRDAVVCHFDPGQAPPLIRLHHVRQELLAL